MTWFGIALVVYYILNLMSNAWVIGQGGVEVTPGTAAFAMLVQVLLIVGIFTVGTGLM